MRLWLKLTFFVILGSLVPHGASGSQMILQLGLNPDSKLVACPTLVTSISEKVVTSAHDFKSKAVKAKNATVKFYKEGVATDGKTFVFAKEDPPEDGLKLRGFVSPVTEKRRGYMKRLFLAFPRFLSRKVPALFISDYDGPAYDFTPLHGIKLNIIDPLVKRGTGRLWGEPYGQFSKPIQVLVLMALMTLTFKVGYIESGKIIQYELARNARIEAHYRADYLATDYRYSIVRSLQNVSPEQKEQIATQMNKSVADFFRYYAGTYLPAHETNAFEADRALILNPDFGPFMRFVYNDAIEYLSGRTILNSPGIRYDEGFSADATPEMVDRLISLETIRFFQMEFVHLLVNNPTALAPYMKDPNMAAIISDIQTDSYTQTLFKMEAHREISRAELIYRLGQDVNWQYIFARNQLFHVTRLVQNEDGTWSNTPVTIEMVRGRFLYEMTNHIPHD